MAQLADYTPRDLDRIRARLRAGETLATVAADLGVPRNTLSSWWRRDRADGEPGTTVSVEVSDDDFAEQLAEAKAKLDAAEAMGLPVASLRVGRKSYPTWERTDEDAAATTTDGETRNVEIVVRPRGVDETEPFVAIEPAPPVTVKVSAGARLPKRRTSDLRTAVIYPDSQLGYWQDTDGGWHTIHDEAALDIALQVTMDVEAEHGIDAQVDLGDLLDFPSFSSHRSAPAVLSPAATNKAIARAGQLLAERAAVAPDAERWWIQGNHDDRLLLWLIDRAPQMVGLRNADGVPVLSLDHLTGASRYGWEIVGPFPEGEVRLTHNLRCIHGTVAKAQPGATAAEYLKHEISTFFGHTTRFQVGYRTVVRGAETRTFVSAGGGGFMRTTGEVPSASGRYTIDGAPAAAQGQPWEQGFFVVHYDPEGSTVPAVEPIPIFGGRAVWRGREYVARCDADGTPVKTDG